MSVQTCPACLSPRLLMYPVSRSTHRRDFKCRECGLVGWADRDRSVPDPVGVDEISIESQSAWFDIKRVDGTTRAWNQVLDHITAILGDSSGKKVYDVGAGDGQFLSAARDRGFEIAGNEIVQAAAEIAHSTHGVELDLGDLTKIDVAPDHDAVTLWCVLAHVPNPDELLTACRDLLKPGGILYLQTPHRCGIDTLALGTQRLTGGRVTRWADRRIAEHHWLLHTRASMTATLERLGFVDIEVRPVARYSLQSTSYLEWLGLRGKGNRLGAKALDAILDRGLAPRIVLDVYARTPGVPAQAHVPSSTEEATA